MPGTIHILLGDPNEHFQNSLELVITKEKCLLTGNASHATELQQLACAQQPDVIIIDVHSPALNGFETIAHLTKHHPATGVIAFSFWQHAHQIQQAIDAGAAGIICKHSPCDNVMKAVRAVHAGLSYRCRKTQQQLDEWRLAKRFSKLVLQEDLSDKERLTLQHLLQGLTHEEVAKKIGLSTRSIEDIKNRLLKKIGGRSFIHCLVRALYHKVADFPEGM